MIFPVAVPEILSVIVAAGAVKSTGTESDTTWLVLPISFSAIALILKLADGKFAVGSFILQFPKSPTVVSWVPNAVITELSLGSNKLTVIFCPFSAFEVPEISKPASLSGMLTFPSPDNAFMVTVGCVVLTEIFWMASFLSDPLALTDVAFICVG